MPTETTELIPTEYQEHLKTYSQLESDARTLARAIKDERTYNEAVTFRNKILNTQRTWLTIIRPAVKAAHNAHQRVKAVENLLNKPLQGALDDSLDPAITRYRVEEENRRRIAQEQINRKLRQEEEDRRIAEAEELAKSGKLAEADEILSAPITAPEVVLPSTTKVEGIQDRTYWSVQIFDIKLLCKAVADGVIPSAYVLPNMPMLNTLSRSLKSAMNAEWKARGVEAVARKDIAGGPR